MGSTEDKETIEEAVKESIDWLETNPDAKRMDYKEKLKELEEICDPIILKLRREDRKKKRKRRRRSLKMMMRIMKFQMMMMKRRKVKRNILSSNFPNSRIYLIPVDIHSII